MKRTLVVLVIMVALVLGHITTVYNGTNKGVIVGTCGYEFIGTPGYFCN